MRNFKFFSIAAMMMFGIGGGAAQAEPRDGTLIYNVKINISSKLTTRGERAPTCKVDAFHFGSLGASYTENVSIVSTRSGNTATCRLLIPFRWANANPNAPVESRLIVTSDFDGLASDPTEVARQLNHRLPDLKVPISGKNAQLSAEVDF